MARAVGGRTGGETTGVETVSQRESKPRLVVELTSLAARRLEELTALEELNKTTVVNRALNVYYLLRMAAENGGEITVTDKPPAEDGTKPEPQRIHFI